MYLMVLDSSVIVPPVEPQDGEEVEAFLSRLLDWLSVKEAKWLRLVKPKLVEERLFAAEVYPYRSRLAALIEKFSIDFADANTLARAAELLLERGCDFEEAFRLRDGLYESLEVAPPLHDALGLTHETISDLCAASLLSPDAVRVARLVLCQSQERPFARVKVQYLEPAPSLALPTTVALSLVFVSSVIEAIIAADLVWLWTQAKADPERLAEVVSLAVRRTQREASFAWQFGHSFWTSADSNGFLHEEAKIRRLLRAILESLHGENEAACHALRTSDAPNAPQRVRSADSARAWRRDIDYEYHLHYWRRDGLIEFCSVGVHNSFDCPE